MCIYNIYFISSIYQNKHFHRLHIVFFSFSKHNNQYIYHLEMTDFLALSKLIFYIMAVLGYNRLFEMLSFIILVISILFVVIIELMTVILHKHKSDTESMWYCVHALIIL